VASLRPLRALITNDDGIDSPGLWALAAAARDAGLDVVVAAPHVDASGVGASVLAVHESGHTVVLHPRKLPGLPGVLAYGVQGHPAFIVHAAGQGWLDPEPDLVLAGINVGANVGRAILHSGTVGAALTAALHGWWGLAVSLDTSREPPKRPHWESATHVFPRVLTVLLAAPKGTVLSLNVPDRAIAELGELREARLARFGAMQVRVDQRTGAAGERLHATFSDFAAPAEPGTDTALLAAGHPTVTELRSIEGRPGALEPRSVNARRPR